MNPTTELEQLRLANARMEAALQELKLEISYYKGETKRLEWEKDVLHHDVQRMSGLFKTWIDEVQNQTNHISDTPEKINMMIKYPCKSISDLLQLSDNILFVTSCQPPHLIEYVSKKWSEECGWSPSEILGLTCSFLQGEMTDKAVTEAFMKDVRSVGYAHMRVYNYRKSGEVFEVDVTVYPVFDSICAIGPDSEVAVLTHFASVMSDIKEFSPGDTETSSSQGFGQNGSGSGLGTDSNNDSALGSDSNGSGCGSDGNSSDQNNSGSDVNDERRNHNSSAGGRTTDSTSSAMIDASVFHVDRVSPLTTDHGFGSGYSSSLSNSEVSDGHRRRTTSCESQNSNQHTGLPNMINHGSIQQNETSNVSNSGYPSMSGSATTAAAASSSSSDANKSRDRRNLDLRFVPKCGIINENFFQFGNTLRLSNLLRLMLSSQDAMALTDEAGRLIHVNTAWVHLTGYEISEVEGLTCKILQGPETDMAIVAASKSALAQNRAFEMTVTNYRKNGSAFLNQVTIVPIQGGFLESKVSHFCSLCREASPPHPTATKLPTTGSITDSTSSIGGSNSSSSADGKFVQSLSAVNLDTHHGIVSPSKGSAFHQAVHVQHTTSSSAPSSQEVSAAYDSMQDNIMREESEVLSTSVKRKVELEVTNQITEGAQNAAHKGDGEDEPIRKKARP